MSDSFYHDKPIFGLDIGFSSLKVMQVEQHRQTGHRVTGYGVIPFESDAIKDGVIIDPEKVAKAANELFTGKLVGDINTNRVAVAIPAAHTFTRTLALPQLSKKDLVEAVRLETEQYVPVPIDNLYFDHSVINRTEKGLELIMVATPKKITDSYLQLAQLLGLEIVAIDTTIGATGRLFLKAERSDVPTIVIDLGSLSSDITIYDKTLIVTGTVPGGGDSFTHAIEDALKVSHEEAHVIKTKYGMGLSKKQREITGALTPIIDEMLKEIKRMIRYYEERSGSQQKIAQVITMGGGANMPGLSEHMTNLLRLPVRTCDPWQYFDFHGLQPPHNTEKTMYATVAGLAITNPKEIFA